MRFRFTVFILTLFVILPASALDVFINNRSWKDVSPEEIDPLLYTVEGSTRGISLDELFPPMYNAYYFGVESTDDTLEWTDDDLADRFLEGYIIPRGESFTLLFDDVRIDGVTTLHVRGEVIEDRSLEVWASWEGVRLLKEEIDRYAELHDADIRVIEGPKTSSKLISILRGGGSPPDLLMVQSSDIPDLVLAGALQHLGYIDTKRFDRRGIEAFTTGGRLYGLPFYCDPQVVFLNRTIIDDPPDFDWTLDDFEKLSRDLLQRGITPASWNAYSASWLIPFQIAFGKEGLLEDDGSIIINDAPSVEALEYILYLQDTGYLDVLERDAMVSLFVSGKVAMILSGSYSIPGFEEINLDFSVLPFPLHPDTGRPVAPLLDYKAFAITRRSKHPVMARRLAEYLTGIGVQQRFPAALSKLGAHSAAVRISAAETAHFDALAESMERGIPIPPEKAYGVYKNTMWSMLRFALTGQLAPEQVMDRGQGIIDNKLDR